MVLTHPVHAILGNAAARGTIQNDDPVPAASIGNASVLEGAEGPHGMVFPVRLSNPGATSIEVLYRTIERSAAEGVDYERTRGSVTFAPKTVAGEVVVQVLGDLECEPDETLLVRISAPEPPSNFPAGVVVGSAMGVGTIRDDDCVTIPTWSGIAI